MMDRGHFRRRLYSLAVRLFDIQQVGMDGDVVKETKCYGIAYVLSMKEWVVMGKEGLQASGYTLFLYLP